MIKSLQSIRFILALLIFHHHFFSPSLPQFGTLPVTFFFILSGFLLSMGYLEKVLDESFSYRRFVIKRLCRIFPLNVIGVAMCLLYPILLDIQNGHLTVYKDVVTIAIDTFLLQSWIPHSGYYFSGNSVCWFLSDILFCYLVFPILLKKMASLSSTSRLIRICVLLLLYFVLIEFFVPEELYHGLIYINPLFRLIDFILGIELYFVFTQLSKEKVLKKSYATKSFQELGTVGTIILTVLLFPFVPEQWSYAAIWWPSVLVSILMFALNAELGGALSKLLSTKFMVTLGGFSFAFYVFHLCFIRWYNIVFESTNYDIPQNFGAVLCVLVVLAFAYIYVKVIEPKIIEKTRFLYE